jgi:HlyD family secretion protein
LAGRSGRIFVRILIIIGIAAAATAAWFHFRPPFELAPSSIAKPLPSTSGLGVSCLGRIQPEDSLVTIGARSVSGQPSIIGELRVKEGQDIPAGYVIAILDSFPQLDAAFRQAEARIRVAQTRLEQVKGGAKTADMAAQQEEITRLEVELAAARVDFSRMDSLIKEGLVSQAALDQSRLQVEVRPKMIAAAKERLRSLNEVRQIDVDVAAAEVEAAMADAARARAEADNSTIRSPYAGRVLKIHAWQGAEVGSQGILELARTSRMYVIAEVAESDIQRVKLGQRVKISGDSLGQPIEGKVERMGLRVSRTSLAVHDPVSLSDARVIEVRILLDDASSVKNLIDAQVEVIIGP